MRVKLPNSCYGFVTSNGETTHKVMDFYGQPVHNIFIAVDDGTDWKQFVAELITINYDLNFQYKAGGWLNEALETKRYVLKFQVWKKPLEQLKLFQ